MAFLPHDKWFIITHLIWLCRCLISSQCHVTMSHIIQLSSKPQPLTLFSKCSEANSWLASWLGPPNKASNLLMVLGTSMLAAAAPHKLAENKFCKLAWSTHLVGRCLHPIVSLHTHIRHITVARHTHTHVTCHIIGARPLYKQSTPSLNLLLEHRWICCRCLCSTKSRLQFNVTQVTEPWFLIRL